MASPKAFDVWLTAANSVYKNVPYQVVADWAQHGRLGAADQLRPAGTQYAWKRLDAVPLFRAYLPLAGPVDAAGVPLPEADDDPPRRKAKEADDDEVDMIPLIDISMVLLVFFVLIRTTGALSPIDVPDMKWAGELSKDPTAVTLSIDKKDADRVGYSVRVGESPPAVGADDLPNPEAALAKLDEVLATLTRPPDVRVACNKALPTERMDEITLELKRRMDKRQINSFEAEVNEAAKKE